MLYEVVKTVGAYRAGERHDWDLPPVVALSAIKAGFIRRMPASGGILRDASGLVEGEVQEATVPKKRGRPKKIVDVADISGMDEADGSPSL